MSLKVSIIMNCLNGERFLQEALQSILDQTYQNWELIFWDNNSNDNSKAIFYNNYNNKMKYFKSDVIEQFGIVRSKALQKATGDLIAFLDTDDVWLPKKLSLQIKYFQKKNVGMVISNTYLFSIYNQKIFYSNSPPTGKIYNNLLKNYFISQETLIFRRSLLEKLDIKNFDSDYNAIVDFDLNMRLSKICHLDYCPEILSKYRIHDNNFTMKNKTLFSQETEKWINYNILRTNNINEVNYLKLLQDSNNSSYARLLLLDNLRKDAFNRIIKCNLFKIKNLITLILIFFPFSNYLMQYYFNKKNRLK